MQPIGIKEAIDDVAEYTTQILRRNRALIDYYIYPHPTPTEIEAYEPRLKALETRIKNLKKLNFPQLRQLIDDPDNLAAFYLLQIIEQLQNAIYGFKRIFEDHYDPSLSQRAPYSHIYERLGDIEMRLNVLKRRSSKRTQPAQSRVPAADRFHALLHRCSPTDQPLRHGEAGSSRVSRLVRGE